MRRIFTLGLLLLSVGLAGSCNSTTIENNFTSFIRVFNNTSGAEIASGQTINLVDGQTLQLRVMRTVTPDEGSPTTTNVTTEADYNVEDDSVITISENGLVTAQSAGSSDVNVVFRDDDGDETDNDEYDFVINVTAAP
jgi:hypothetical protein